nr:hypothetical protein [Tanacetum cinerariifolium]
MVTIDGEGVDWTGYAKDDTRDYAFLLLILAIQAHTLSQMSAKDKSGLGYGSQIHDGVLSYENKDKGKGVLEEPEPAKKMTRSDLDAAQIAKDAKREEEASKAAIAEMYDEVQAGIKANALFTAKLQQEEREYTIEKKAKFLAKTIAAQRRFRAAQRSAEIRSLYERQKRVIDDFKPMDSDDAVDKEKVLEEPDSTKVEVKQEGDEESIRKRPGRRHKMKATKKSKRQKIDSDLKEEEYLKTFIHGAERIYYRIFRSDGSSRWIKTFSEMETRIMFEETTDDDLWKNQEELILKSWNFYKNYGVHTLTCKDGTKIYMLAERRYPLIKETLERMLALRLIVESESEAVFDLLRFIQKQIDESGSHDGSEKDLAPCYCNEALAIPEQTNTEDDKDSKLTKEKFKELQCVWIHPPGVQEAQDEET